MDLEVIRQELYGLSPEDFIAARQAAVKTAKASGDGALAAQVGAMKKPTVAAWVVNQAARFAELDLRVLLDVGSELRDGMGDLSGEDMRALTRRRQSAVSTLMARAQQLASDQGRKVAPDALAAVRATFEATLADPDAAEAVRRGCLSEPLEVGGFAFALGGFAVPAADLDDEPDASAPVADLDARRERRAAAIRGAETELVEAQERADEAAVLVEEAAARVTKAQRRKDTAAQVVARLRLELTTAESDEADAERRLSKRVSAHESAEDELEEARDDVAAAQAALDRLTR